MRENVYLPMRRVRRGAEEIVEEAMKEKLPCGHELEKIAYHCEPCCDEVSSKLESESLRLEICQKALRDAELQIESFKRRLNQAVNSRCSCGGMGPGACGCDYCALYHFVLGNTVSEAHGCGDSSSCPECAKKRLCSGGECRLEEGHEGDHHLNLRRRCICPNGTRTAIAHVNGCPAGGG